MADPLLKFCSAACWNGVMSLSVGIGQEEILTASQGSSFSRLR